MHSVILHLIVCATVGQAFNSEKHEPVGQRRCFRPARIEIPECQGAFYNFTGLPNLVGQESQVDAQHQLQTFKPLITYTCSKHLQFFLCSVYAPMCDVNTHHLIGPCRPLCENVRNLCSPVLRIFGFNWPANLNCSRFPEKNMVGGTMCMEGPNEGPGDTNKANVAENVGVMKEKDVALTPDSNEAGQQQKDISDENLIRQLEVLPEAKGTDVTKLGVNIQTWLSKLNQNPLPSYLGNNVISLPSIVSSIRFCSHLTKPTSYVFINRTGRCAPHCESDILFSDSAKTLATVWTSVVSGFCLLATTCTLLSYAIQPSLFHPLERSIIYIAGCQLAYALGFALRLKLGRNAVTCGRDPASGFEIRLQEGLDNSNCALIFLIQYYFFTAGSIWWTMMVFGWASRSAYILRLLKNPSEEPGTAYIPSGTTNSCCCVSPSGTDKDDNYAIDAHRSSQVHRRINNLGSSIDINCLAKEHIVAWLTPGLLTVGVLVSRQVDADELLGICGVGRQNTKAMLIFMLVPQLLFLLLGIGAFLFCCVHLFKLAKLWDRWHIPHSTTLSQVDPQQTRCHTYQAAVQQSELDSPFNSDVGSVGANKCYTCCCKSVRWDGLSTRLGFFSLLYIVPAVSIIICDFYEFLYRDKWLTVDGGGSKISAKQTTPEIFLLRTFMSLVTGFATCLWVLSNKGIEPWRQLTKQIESRYAQSGFLCFSKPLKNQTLISSRQLPNQKPSSYGKLKEQQVSQICTPSNTSTVLHPYAVYQHCCSSIQSDHCDVSDKHRCYQGGSGVHLSKRPPAGPGLDAGEQFFMQSGLSMTQASGYYSSASKHYNIPHVPCPPPDTPPPLPCPRGQGGPSQSNPGWCSALPQNPRHAIL